MVISQNNLEYLSGLIPQIAKEAKQSISLEDIERVCRILMSVIKQYLPLACLEYDVDLFESKCYLYVDGEAFDEKMLSKIQK